MSRSHRANNKSSARIPSTIRRAKAGRKRSQRVAAFTYPKPFFPQFQTLLNEACRGGEAAVTEAHVLTLVAELAATRQTLELLCPNYEIPTYVRRWIARISGVPAERLTMKCRVVDHPLRKSIERRRKKAA